MMIDFRLRHWRMLHVAHDVHLIVGELIANAVRSTPDGEIRIRVVREPDSILLWVWDGSDEMPVARPVAELTLDDIVPDPHALDPGHDDGTGGWGLPIVQALSSECGVHPTEPHGKWVWARVKS